MAERRNARVATDEARPVVRRPARRDVPAATETDDRDFVDEDETEAADQDVPEAEDETETEPEDIPEVEDETEPEAAEEGHGRRATLTAREAAEAAVRQIAEFTTKQVEGITEVEQTDDGWLVGLEVVEDRRIPSSTDVLAIYETAIDTDGEVVSYRRTRRYARGRGDDGGES
jgi:Gas vesicle synthesis protein GvpO